MVSIQQFKFSFSNSNKGCLSQSISLLSLISFPSLSLSLLYLFPFSISTSLFFPLSFFFFPLSFPSPYIFPRIGRRITISNMNLNLQYISFLFFPYHSSSPSFSLYLSINNMGNKAFVLIQKQSDLLL